jgi:hypothetical protein
MELDGVSSGAGGERPAKKSPALYHARPFARTITGGSYNVDVPILVAVM